MSRKAVVALVALFFVSVAGVSAVFFMMRTDPTYDDELEAVMPADGRLHVLIVGVDAGLVAPGRQGVGRSDTLMLASYDPKTSEISMMSILRDTRVNIPGYRNKTRINHAYAYGGIDLTLQTVRNFLNVPIRYYVQVDTNGFRRLVDAIGGVPIDVEKDMNYRDNAGGLVIKLKKGPQILNGEQAEGYVRYRHTDSDHARVQRQQKFIGAAVQQVLKPANLLKINQLIQIGLDTVKTNMPLHVAMRYLPMVQSLQADKITTYTIPGNDIYIDGAFYFEPDINGLEEIVQSYFYAGTDNSANQDVRVRVLVGNNNRSVAEQVAQLLRRGGFQVMEVTAANRDDYQVSQVISTKRESQGAVRVAETLSVHEVLLDTKADSEADVVVIVGKDMLP